MDEKNDLLHLNHIGAGHWSFRFDPKRLFHNRPNERLYYLFEKEEVVYSDRKRKCRYQDPKKLTHLNKLPCRIALVKPELAIHLMKKTKVIIENEEKFPEEPMYKLVYKTKEYDLQNANLCQTVLKLLSKFSMYGKEIHPKKPNKLSIL